MTDSRSDEQLLAAFAGGERAALGTLASRHEHSLLGLAMGLLGGDKTLAMDAVQDVWIRVIRGAAGFREASAVQTWLHRILVNRCHDLRATRDRNHTSSHTGSLREAPESCTTNHDELRVALDALTPDHRDVLLICYHDGMTHPVAAAALDVPLGTLKSRLNAALAKLRERLAQEAAMNTNPSIGTDPDESGDLASRLAAATRWVGPAPELWQKALDSEAGVRQGSHADNSRLRRLWAQIRVPIPRPWLAAAAVIVIGAMVTSLPHLGTSHRQLANTVPPAGPTIGVTQSSYGLAEPSGAWRFDQDRDKERGQGPRFEGRTSESPPPPELQSSASPQGEESRLVVRKATVELLTDDVRAAFLKAAMLVSDAGGEFVQDSSLTGEGKTAAANLTLRIAADRLSAVLTGLRDLGKVNAETRGGEDVTDQMVDLEARLRNEQRIEIELLDLLTSRKDAPLADVLKVRESLADVRNSIERLAAQRERLGKLVSLATVLVIIRADNAPEPVTHTQSLGKYFNRNISEAWNSSLRFLSDSAAFVIRVAIGGAPWWAAALIVFLVLRSRSKRAASRPATPS